MDQDVGYCPQFEALDPLCSVEEMLFTFCRLKGIPSSMMKDVCTSVLKRFSLESYSQQIVHKLSGGTKRKLSTAIALLGDPSLVLLDEPTTGMDPKTRRLVWNNILRVLREDRSVILTSHSMAECDALCTRMAIMVNGRFQCLGTGQHLKDKYGTGYTLTMRTKSPRDVLQVINYIKTTFRGSKVKDQHLNQITMETPNDAGRLSLIFGNLEQDRHKLGILDYSVRQTTLDQIFVNFARTQTDGVTEIEEVEAAEAEAMGSLEDYPHTSPNDKPSLRGYPPSHAENPYVAGPADPSEVEVAVVKGPHSHLATPPNVSIVSVHPASSDITSPEQDDDNVTVVTVM
jgi:ABC-type multidrug transport system ATPase subunit